MLCVFLVKLKLQSLLLLLVVVVLILLLLLLQLLLWLLLSFLLQVEKYLIMLLVKLGKYEENPEQRQGGNKADAPFAKVDCSVILQEMHSFFECLPVKQDTKVCVCTAAPHSTACSCSHWMMQLRSFCTLPLRFHTKHARVLTRSYLCLGATVRTLRLVLPLTDTFLPRCVRPDLGNA